ncbi:hypothetical protein DSO57_1006904 [Entomophthora muscae]|uniref:Uncharacterized protein n=1 Tax=Entomophthora muscae TaxID=34485 RepID=A0ACC2U5Y9_9FUNG|nr:hypothetical protein DSO57_1006904 [Entomophthora muscae]
MKRRTILGDGNCLFRALSHQLAGHENLHLQIREEICNYMEEHSAHFAPFSSCNEEDFKLVVDDMRTPGIFGGNAELAAFANIYDYTIRVYHNCIPEPINIEPVSLTDNNSDNSELDDDDDDYLSPYESACQSDLLPSTIVDCLFPVRSDSDSEFKPESKYNKKPISRNICKVMQRSSCEDKERIFDLLLENNNKLKKVLHILKDEHKELLASPSYHEGSSPYYTCSEGELSVCYDSPTFIKFKSSQESTEEPAVQIEPLSTSNILPSKLQPASPIAPSSSVSLKSLRRDEEEEKQISPKKAKSNNHCTSTKEKAHFTEPAALIEPSSFSNSIPLKLQTTSPIEATRSSVSLKSLRQDEEEEKQVSPKRAKSSSHGTPAGAEAHFTKLAAPFEPSSTSNSIPSTSQTAYPLEVTSSSLSIKSPHHYEEEEEKFLPKKAISNNHVTLPETETSINLSAIP